MFIVSHTPKNFMFIYFNILILYNISIFILT
nr:MAG TPA: hypothetical protein [Caudoviricetes sp.]